MWFCLMTDFFLPRMLANVRGEFFFFLYFYFILVLSNCGVGEDS